MTVMVAAGRDASYESQTRNRAPIRGPVRFLILASFETENTSFHLGADADWDSLSTRDLLFETEEERDVGVDSMASVSMVPPLLAWSACPTIWRILR